MPAFDSTNTTILSANATMAYLPTWFARHDRDMIAMDARWLALSEQDPGSAMGDYAARSVYQQPAIVWG